MPTYIPPEYEYLDEPPFNTTFELYGFNTCKHCGQRVYAEGECGFHRAHISFLAAKPCVKFNHSFEEL